MKYLIGIVSVIDLWFGIQCVLNVVGVLQNSKYSSGATKVFALIFISMGLAGLFWSVIKPNLKWALAVSLGPWIVALVFLLITMMTSDYQ